MADLTSFQETLQASNAGWDAFHRRYDAWRASDGDCPHDAVRDKLTTFATEFESLVGRVNRIVRPSLVRPLAEQLIEAVVSEAGGLATLRDSWNAYDSGPWSAFDASRSEADQLRRQVRSALDELNLRFGLSEP